MKNSARRGGKGWFAKKSLKSRRGGTADADVDAGAAAAFVCTNADDGADAAGSGATDDDGDDEAGAAVRQ